MNENAESTVVDFNNLFDFSGLSEINLLENPNSIDGTDSEEILLGTSNSEAIVGLKGNDTLVGKDGSDTLSGGDGNDLLQTGRGDNIVLGNRGNDELVASNIRLEEAGNNIFNGGDGNDVLRGNNGNDLLVGETGNDIIDGLNGVDTIDGGDGNDNINGDAGNDFIDGNLGDDELTGGDGNDIIFGGDGSDTIDGLEGQDILNGNEGNDFFELIPGTGEDVIADFEDGVDRLVLSPTARFGSDLTFEQLSITQDNNNNAVIAIAQTNERLAIVADVTAESIDSSDFISNPLEIENVPSREPLPSSSVGLVTSQGAEVVNAEVARDLFGVDGSGIRVGIISDSFDRNESTTITATDDVATGDLPGEGSPNGNNTPVEILDDSADNSASFGNSGSTPTDEGRAMAQIIADIAPGADILFHTGTGDINDYAEGIDELVAAGADIIVDDVVPLAEPFFQDGIVARAANRAADAGVAYFASAGNFSSASYESEFSPVEDNPGIAGLENYSFHDFDPGEGVDIFQNIPLEPGQEINLSFQWDEPFASAGGAGASNDLDVFLLDADNNIVSVSAESNVGSDAVELIDFSNSTDAAAEYRLVIGRDLSAGGEAPNSIKYIDFESTGSLVGAEYITGGPTIFGRANAENVAAVGESFYQTPTEVIIQQSSIGIVPILFDEQGNRISEPELRQKPDIVAPVGGNNTFFAAGPNVEEDGFPNFFGTSAAAPHAAGVAALLLDAVPDATPQQVYGALEQTAIDLDNPLTSEFDTGFDTATGFGLIQADAALDALVA